MNRGSLLLDFLFHQVEASFRRHFLLTYFSPMDLFFLRMTCRILRKEVYELGVLMEVKGKLRRYFFKDPSTTIEQWEKVLPKRKHVTDFEKLAAQHGREDFLDYFKPNDVNELMYSAGQCKNIGLVRRLIAMGGDRAGMVLTAIAHGNFPVIELCIDVITPTDALRHACMNGRFDVIKWMCDERGFPLPERAVGWIGGTWTLDFMVPIFSYLIFEKKLPWADSLKRAILNRSYELAVWMHSHGAPALVKGDENLKYFVTSLVRSGEWKILLWATVVFGIHPDRWFFACVNEWEHTLLEKLFEIGGAMPSDPKSFVFFATTKGHRACFQVIEKYMPDVASHFNFPNKQIKWK